jgi:hypothetical protein
LLLELVYAMVVDMFRGLDALAAVVCEVTVAPTGEALAEAMRIRDALDARIAAGQAEYVKIGGYEVDGYGSIGAFLRLRGGLTVPDSRRVARRSAKLGAWPEVTDAWVAGRLDGPKVDVMCAKVPRRHVDRFAVTAAATVEVLAPLTVDEVSARLDDWVTEADGDAEREAAEDERETETAPPARELFVSRSIDDIRFLGGQLDADSAVPVEEAIKAATVADLEGERRTPAERRADALVEICRFYLAHHQNPPNAARPDRLVLVADPVSYHRAALRGAGVRTVADLETFLSRLPAMALVERGLFLEAFDGTGGVARTLDGNPVSDALLACVASGGLIERVLTAEGRIIDHGRTVREFTDAQRRAILARDRGCRTPGCDAPAERCHIHHVRQWDDGGSTDIANGVAKCRRCHLKHHRERWTDLLEPDGTYALTSPIGVRQTSRPPGWQTPQPRLPVHTSAQPAPQLAFIDDDLDDGDDGDWWEPELTDEDIAWLDEQVRLRNAELDEQSRRYRELPRHPTVYPRGVGLVDLILNHSG